MATLLEIFPEPHDLLALEPEELAEVLIEQLHALDQTGDVTFNGITGQIYAPDIPGPPLPGRYDPSTESDVLPALAASFSWLEMQGLIVRNPTQPSHNRYLLTRRGRKIRSRADVSALRLGRTLPIELLQPGLAEKVHHLFLRGDYEVAVFQAFKMVEVEVRRAAKCAPDDVGVKLMRKAFDPKTGPLTLTDAPEGEKQAMSDLFAGAMGHAKNPGSHRDVRHSRQSAARLIMFASELLEIMCFAELIG